jgi:glycerophosphoryl diester phosphodiesterase
MSGLDLPPPPWVVAHRGASGERLENTIASCALAVAAGAPMIEVDVQLAADGEPVVVHDWDLRRLGAGRRSVERLTAPELAAVQLALPARSFGGLPAGAATAPPLRGFAPTLAGLLGALPADFPLNLELKRRHADREAFAAALAVVAGDRRNLLFSSFDHALLVAVARALPAALLAPLEADDPAALVAAGARLGAWSLHCHQRLATAGLIVAAREARRHLLVYTVNDAATARALFASGVAGVFSDWPAQLLAALAGARRPPHARHAGPPPTVS